MRKIATVVGARPQFVKAAPLSLAMARNRRLREIGIHTGQHYDDNMAGIFFREMNIPEPSMRLDIHGGSHGQMTGRMLEAIEKALIDTEPDAVVVFGDTNSTLAGGLAAAKLQIPLFHVEAGLRSYNRSMPEEINRVMVDHLSQLLLCPTAAAIENLAKEGLAEGVRHVGDLMYDATLQMLPVAQANSTILERLAVTPGAYCVATIHRADNTATGDALESVLRNLAELAAGRPVVLPLHPRTRAFAASASVDLDRPDFRIIEPVGYLDMQVLLAGASLVATDSGGVQKEAYFHRVPCVTLRSETEWVETIDHGWNRLWSVADYAPRRDIEDYGAGRSAEAIVDAMLDYLDGR